LLKAAHPKGPYVLMGLCIAGALAAEVARQLQAGGDEVRLVVTYDTWRPGFTKSQSLLDRIALEVMDRVDVHVRRWKNVRKSDMTASEWLLSFKFAYALAELAVKLGLLKEAPKRATGWTPPWFQRHLLNARKDYENPGFAGDLIVFKSEQTPRGPLFDAQMGWRDAGGGHVIVHDARGGHLTMLSEPNAPEIAANIKAALETTS